MDLKLGLFTKNFIGTFMRQIGVGIIGLVSAVVIARVYGPEGNGAFAIAVLLPTLLGTVLNLGIGPANVYFLGSKQVMPQIAFKVSIKVFMWLTVIGLLLGIFLVKWQGAVFFPGIDERLLLMGLPIFPVALLNGYLLSIFHGQQMFKEYNTFLIVQPLMFFVMVLLLYFIDIKDLEILVLCQLLSHCIGLLLMFVAMKKSCRSSEGVDQSCLANADSYQSKAISYGWKSNLSNILGFINYKTDIFLVNFFLSPVAAGVYVIAVTLAEKLWLISGAVCTVLLPRLSELSSEEDKRKSLTPIISRLTFAITTIAGLVLLVLANYLVAILFGQQYLDSISPLLWLLPGVIILAVAKVWANDLAARGRPEINTYIAFITLTANIIGNVILIPLYGLSGAAMATSMAYLICSIITLMVYVRISKNSWANTLFVNVSDIQALMRLVKK